MMPTCKCSLLANMTTHYLPTRSMSRSQKDKTWPKSIILAHFKGICAEFVKLMFTMFFNVHMRIFCVMHYMTNFLLNCIQSGGGTGKAAQNASKHIFSSYSRLYLPIHWCSDVIVSLHLVFIQHSLQCFQKHLQYSKICAQMSRIWRYCNAVSNFRPSICEHITLGNCDLELVNK